MTQKALALCLALVTVPAIGATTESSPPPSIDAYLSPKTIDKHGLNDTLWQLLNDAGQTVGFRGGKAQRAWELQQVLVRTMRLIAYIRSPPSSADKVGYLR